MRRPCYDEAGIAVPRDCTAFHTGVMLTAKSADKSRRPVVTPLVCNSNIRGQHSPMTDTNPNKLRIEYKKSNSFRVIHADGAYGGTSPRLQLFIAFYSER